MQRYTGRWNLVAAESDNIDAAIETAIRSMNFVARPIARSRLKRRNVAFPHFDVSVDGRGLRVHHADGLDVVYPAVGESVKTRSPDGSDITTRLGVEPALLLTYDAEAGRREDTYVLDAKASKLILNVRLTSSSLPKALTYRLVYRRQ